MSRLFLHKCNKDESGSTIPFYITFFVVIVSVITIAANFSGAMLIHEVRNNDLAEVKNIVESDAYALKLKNTNNPGSEFADLVKDNLRSAGYNGKIQVYFYECSQKDIAAIAPTKAKSRRVFGWIAVTNEPYGMFSIGTSINVQSVISGTIMPYSGGKTWRPTDAGDSQTSKYNGLYEFSTVDTGNTKSFKAISSEYTDNAWPQTMEDILSERLQKMAAEKTDNFNRSDPIWWDK